MIEEWRDVEGYSRYKVSNLGEVLDTREDRKMPQTVNGGFWCTNLFRDDGVKVLAKVHRLVAIAFIPNPENLYMVEHIECRDDNSAGNLRWKPKKVKEVKQPKEEPTLNFNNTTYTYKEFSFLTGCEISKLRSRINSGWTPRECFTGIKEFKGSGYQTDTHWFPNKESYEQALGAARRETLEVERKEKLATKSLARAERKAKIHHGVGVFVNYPIKGIEGRKASRTYYVWQGIISRCYSPLHDSYERYGGRGVTVDERWHHFQEFAKWYVIQQERGIGNAHINWHVDKDILFEGNTVYGPETCCFVPDDVNTFFATLNAKGYGLYKGLFKVSLSIAGNKYQRCFRDEQDAAIWYSRGKTKAAEMLLWKYEGLLDDRVVDRLKSV